MPGARLPECSGTPSGRRGSRRRRKDPGPWQNAGRSREDIPVLSLCPNFEHDSWQNEHVPARTGTLDPATGRTDLGGQPVIGEYDVGPSYARMVGYSSGQRGQTVNLLAMPSEVRILLPPPFFPTNIAFLLSSALRFESRKVYHKATSRSGAFARSKQHGGRNQETICRSTVQFRRETLGISCR